MMYALFRLLHLATLLVYTGALLISIIASKPTINSEDVENLAKVDLVGSLALVLAFFFGLSLWLWVGKPPDFYSDNPLFHVKVSLFFVLILLALLRKYLMRRSVGTDTEEISVPSAVRVLLRVEMVVLVTLPILAFLAARGIGLPTTG